MVNLIELQICYIEQFGLDLDLNFIRGLDLGTILRLEEIRNEEVQKR